MWDLDTYAQMNDDFEKRQAHIKAVAARLAAIAPAIKQQLLPKLPPLEQRFNEALTPKDAAWLQSMKIAL